MSILRNLPQEMPRAFKDLIEYKKNQIVSMALSESDHFQVFLFAFSDNETISEEEYFGDTMYHILDGETYLTQGDTKHHLKEGDVFSVAAHSVHSVGGKGPCKLLQITVSE